MSMRGGERDRCSIVGRENGSFWILGELGGHCCNVTIDVAVVGHYLIFFNTDRGIKFILATKSHSYLPLLTLPNEQGIVKLPGSFIFAGMRSCIMVLHSCVNATVSNSPILFFFERISLRNFT